MFYDRFTTPARKAMSYAREEARRLNHDYIGTEHILLGLIKDGSNVACDVLRKVDVDITKLRRDVEELVQPGSEDSTTTPLPFPPRSKKVIECTLEEALALGHNYIGAEHLLLGLLRENGGVAAHVLIAQGVTLDRVRQVVVGVPDTDTHAQPEDRSKPVGALRQRGALPRAVYAALTAVAILLIGLSLFLYRMAGTWMYDSNYETFRNVLSPEQQDAIIWSARRLMGPVIGALVVTNVAWGIAGGITLFRTRRETKQRHA